MRPRQFELLVEGFGRLIAQAVRRVAGKASGNDLEDIQQDVMLALWKRLSREQSIDHPASYLFMAGPKAVMKASASGAAPRTTRASEAGSVMAGAVDRAAHALGRAATADAGGLVADGIAAGADTGAAEATGPGAAGLPAPPDFHTTPAIASTSVAASARPYQARLTPSAPPLARGDNTAPSAGAPSRTCMTARKTAAQRAHVVT